MRWPARAAGVAILVAVAACGGGGGGTAGGGETIRPDGNGDERRPAPVVGPGCAELAAGDLGEPIALLGGRLEVRMPEGARVQEPPSPPASEAELPALVEETRVEIGEGEARLALLAFELFERSVPDLLAAVQQETTRRETGDTVEALPVQDSRLRVVTATPGRPSRDPAVFVLGAWVAHPDGTLQLVAFYASRAAASDLGACSAVARRIVATLAAGDRALDATGGARTITGGAAPLTLTLPSGWVHDARAGGGFVVHRFRALRPIGAGGLALGVYLGDRPRPLVAQARETLPPRPGTLFGHAVEWTQFVVGPPDAARYAAETMAPLPGGTGAASIAHVFLEAPSAAEAAELVRVAETLRPAAR